ncbi:hypothetical protein Csa_014520 [Cucumis sativus]|nr:hypothetical protein Csa_014520 [Cucumis sativus]
MPKLSLSHLSSLFRSSSLSPAPSFSPSRLSISPFIGSDAPSRMSSLHRSDLTGSLQPHNQFSGCLRDSANVGREIVGRGWKSMGVQGPSSGLARPSEGRNLKPMNFVRGILEEEERGFFGTPQFLRPSNMEHNADIVHIKLMRNNSFVTVTDNKGNTKLKASAGRLEGGAKLSRYSADSIAEYVGRESRKLGLKSVVMRVKGFTFFKKKKQAILSWRDGFTDSRTDQNPIVYVEDTTRRAHNGCRLPKKRRV